MGAVKQAVSDLMQMLGRGQKEAKSLAGIMDELQSYLEEESTTIICGSLDRLLNTIRAEVDNLIGGSARVLVSPEGKVTVGTTYSDEDSDSWLRRLKSEGVQVMTLDVFSSLIQTLKSEVAEGDLIPIIEFLRANAGIKTPLVYLGASPAREVEQPREPATSSQWKPPDFFPAPPPFPPLPRGLFKD